MVTVSGMDTWDVARVNNRLKDVCSGSGVSMFGCLWDSGTGKQLKLYLLFPRYVRGLFEISFWNGVFLANPGGNLVIKPLTVSFGTLGCGCGIGVVTALVVEKFQNDVEDLGKRFTSAAGCDYIGQLERLEVQW